MNSCKEIVINLENLINNINEIKKITKNNLEIVITLKADSYGHGIKKISSFLNKKGFKYFGVTNIEEGKIVRKNAPLAKILLYLKVYKKYIKEVVKLSLSPFVADFSYIKEIEKEALKQNKIINLHLKVDVGMNRYGEQIENALKLAKYIKESSALKLEGICSHLPSTHNRELSEKQIKNFINFIKLVKEKNIEFKYSHISNSSHIINYPLKNFNMIRPGIMLYGYLECGEVKNKVNLKPVLNLYSKILFIKDIKANENISYSGLYRTRENTKIAIIPLGYFDGIPQFLNSDAFVLLRGERAYIRGKVCMNQLIIEIPKNLKNVKEGERVEIISENIDLYNLSKTSSRSVYELLCFIGRGENKKYIN